MPSSTPQRSSYWKGSLQVALDSGRQLTFLCRWSSASSKYTQTDFLPHRLEQIARVIDLYVNSDKTEFMCFNHDDIISSLNSKPMKLTDQFLFLGSNISSTESDVNIRVYEAWAPLGKLPNLFPKIEYIAGIQNQKSSTLLILKTMHTCENKLLLLLIEIFGLDWLVCLVGFYGISTFLGYVIPNLLYAYILNMICNGILLIPF